MIVRFIPVGMKILLCLSALFCPARGQQVNLDDVPVAGSYFPHLTGTVTYDFEMCELDDDGEPEAVILRKDGDHKLFLTARNLEQNTYYGAGLELQPGLRGPAYYNLYILREGRHPFFLFRALFERATRLYLIDKNIQMIDSLETVRGYDQTGNQDWVGSARHFQLVDLDNDYRDDLFFVINTGGDGQPRGIFAYDLYTKKQLLKKFFAPLVTNIKAVDLNLDGENEIVAAFGGADDGPFFGEFARDSSYLAILKNDGSVIKSWPLGNNSTYTQFELADLNGDRYPDIIHTFYAMKEGANNFSFLQIIDGRTLTVLDRIQSSFALREFEEVAIFDIDGDGQLEIFTNSPAGYVHIVEYDRAEKRLVSTLDKEFGTNSRFLLRKDMNGDGRPEFVVWMEELRQLVTLTDIMEPLCKVSLSGIARVAKMQDLRPNSVHDQKFVFLADSTLYTLNLTEEEIFGRMMPDKIRLLGFSAELTRPQSFVIVLILGASLVVAVIGLVRTRGRGSTTLTLASERIGYCVVDRKGKVLYANPSFLSIFGLPQKTIKQKLQLVSAELVPELFEAYLQFCNSPVPYFHRELRAGDAGRKKTISIEIVHSFNRSKAVEIYAVNLSETLQSERLRLWAAMVQRIAHQTKTPLGTVMLAIQRLQRDYSKKIPELADHFDKFSSTALEEVERVRDNINALMKFVNLSEPVLVTRNLNEALQTVLQSYQSRVPDKLEIRTQFDPENMPVKIDDKQFAEAIVNFLDNAITAMKGQGFLTIRTQLESHPLSETEGEMALIEIIDSGPGIPRDQLKNLFTPGHTTTEYGSGLGLVISKSIIESFKGHVEVASTEGIGTTVFCRLPIIKTGIGNE